MASRRIRAIGVLVIRGGFPLCGWQVAAQGV
jgi:hypothetical protein